MTKRELLELTKNCDDDARVTVVAKDGTVQDAYVHYMKASEGFLKNDEIYLLASP